jgi:hypothetical protein
MSATVHICDCFLRSGRLIGTSQQVSKQGIFDRLINPDLFHSSWAEFVEGANWDTEEWMFLLLAVDNNWIMLPRTSLSAAAKRGNVVRSTSPVRHRRQRPQRDAYASVFQAHKLAALSIIYRYPIIIISPLPLVHRDGNGSGRAITYPSVKGLWVEICIRIYTCG